MLLFEGCVVLKLITASCLKRLFQTPYITNKHPNIILIMYSSPPPLSILFVINCNTFDWSASSMWPRSPPSWSTMSPSLASRSAGQLSSQGRQFSCYQPSYRQLCRPCDKIIRAPAETPDARWCSQFNCFQSIASNSILQNVSLEWLPYFAPLCVTS